MFPVDESFLSAKATEWEGMADGLDYVILLLDDECRVLRANRTVEEWGISTLHQAAGRSALELFDPRYSDGSVLKLAWKRYVAMGYPSRQLEIAGLDEGLKRRLEVQLKRFEINGRAPPGPPMTLATIRDITAVEDARTRDRRVAQLEAGQMLQQSLAHELGNPLAALCATLEVMDGPALMPSSNYETYLRRASEAACRMRSIIEKALSPSGLAGISLSNIELDDLMYRLESLFSAEMEKRGLDFRVSTDDGLVARADKVALEQVLFNAVTNAAQATSLGGEVRVDAFRFHDFVIMTVNDTGHGMSQDVLDGLFLPFQSTKSDGLGLGASYSAFLMRKMGGRMEVESAANYGTQVTFRVEAAEPSH